jgi:hypothetical protein
MPWTRRFRILAIGVIYGVIRTRPRARRSDRAAIVTRWARVDCDTIGCMTVSLDDVDWPVRTGRLVIRPALDDDEEAIWSYRKLEATSTWLNTQHRDRAAFRAAFQDPGERADTLVIEHGGAVIGNLLVRIDDAWSQTEVREKAARTQPRSAGCCTPITSDAATRPKRSARSFASASSSSACAASWPAASPPTLRPGS